MERVVAMVPTIPSRRPVASTDRELNSDSPPHPSLRLQEGSGDHDQHTSASGVQGVERRGSADVGGLGGSSAGGLAGAGASTGSGRGQGGRSDSGWARHGGVERWVGCGDGCDDLGDGDGLGHVGRRGESGGRTRGPSHSEER